MSVIIKGGGGKPEEEKTVTAGTSVIEVLPSSGKTIKKVTVNPTPSQSKSVTPNESAQTVSPDSGKLLSSVSVGAIQTEEKTVTAGTSAIVVNPSSGKVMKKVTVNPTPSQEKTIKDPSETTIIIPDKGKLLSKVTINIFNPSLVTWAGGTDEEIVKMVQLADEGKINLSDYWAVGDTRTVQLSAMSATGVGDSHPAQEVDLVLMHAGGYELNEAVANGRTKCSFVVGLKHCLADGGYMNSSNTNSGSWNGSARRTWCNNVFRNAIPSTLRAIFKQFKTVTAQTYWGSTNQTSVDYFALPAEREIFGASKYCNETEYNALFQFDYYKTASNRVKKFGKTGRANIWWERSPYSSYSNAFCSVNSDGTVYNGMASNWSGLAPFGCI